ncbi:MAG: hypothetical protein K8F30_08895 [Taibaiella sp.]|nr:hypothetical protein [Taibaiella sp.]
METVKKFPRLLMKPQLLGLCFVILASNKSQAQSFIQQGSDLVTDQFTNNVGIGITAGGSPTEKLTVNGDIGFESQTNTTRTIRARADQYLEISNDGPNTKDESSIKLSSNGQSTGGIEFHSNCLPGMRPFEFFGAGASLLRIDMAGSGGGMIGINTAPNPLTDHLTINGDIGFEESAVVRNIKGRTQEYLEINGNSNGADGGSLKLYSTSFDYNGDVELSSASVGNIDLSNQGTPLVRVVSTGAVGFGDISPSERITVNGNIAFTQSTTDTRYVKGKSGGQGLTLCADGDLNDGAAMQVYANGRSVDPGAIQMTATGQQQGQAFDLSYNPGSPDWTSLLYIDKNGNSGFNDNAPVDRVTINGDMSFKTNSVTRYIRGRSSAQGLETYANRNADDGAGLLMFGNTRSANPGAIQMFASGANGTTAFELSKRVSGQTTPLLYVNKNGQAAIGINNPLDNLTVNGSTIGFAPNTGGFSFIRGRSQNHGLVLFGNSEFSDGAGIRINSVSTGGSVMFMHSPGSASSAAYDFAEFDGTNYKSIFHIRRDGTCVIGNVTVPNNNYKLFVETGILTERIRVAVKNSGDWSDYVFAEDYNLMPLDEVEKYITCNQHLPDVPSAETVVKEGIDVAQMDARLLQKIEELTLYLIEQQKRIEKQDTQLQVYKRELDNVKQQIK